MSIIKNYKHFLLVLIIFLFSTSVNFYYGLIGVFPLDSFLSFDTGYKFINGELPFRDFWTPFGFTLDLFQGLIFKLFGVSWYNYLFHSSLLNFFLALSTFYVLNKFNVKLTYSFFFSLILSVISYPVPATPFLDHHSLIFSLFMMYCFILHLKTDKNFYLILAPIFFSLAFLSKQTPSAYILVCLSIVGIFYLIFNFSIIKILSLFLGTIIVLILFFLYFFINDISLISFWYQYVLFPLTIGDIRLNSDFLFPLEFNRVVTRFKIIHLSLVPILISIFFDLRQKFKIFYDKDFYIKFSVILFSYSLIFHQLLTLNQKYIFMIIPVNLAFSYIFSKDFKFKYINKFLLFIGLATVIYYKISYLDNRKFMELEDVNLNNTENAKTLHPNFQSLKWITPEYKNNPSLEIKKLRDVFTILNSENRNVIILTHYQFFSALLNKKNFFTFSKTYTYDSISLPKKDEKYFLDYKQFVFSKIKRNKINIIYIIGTDINSLIINDLFGKDCLKILKENEILKQYDISKCQNY